MIETKKEFRERKAMEAALLLLPFAVMGSGALIGYIVDGGSGAATGLLSSVGLFWFAVIVGNWWTDNSGPF